MNPQRILFEQFKFLPVPVRRWAATAAVQPSNSNSAQDIQPVAAKSATAHAAAAKIAA